MNKEKKRNIINKLKELKSKGIPIIGGGAGNGLIAKCEESSGIDFIMIFNSGKFRTEGKGSLSGIMPYGNANDIVLNLSKEIIPIIKQTPIIAGVCCTDPYINLKDHFKKLIELGFCGVNNFPSVGIINGSLRNNLEETGMGFGKEVEAMNIANTLDILTMPYVFNEIEAELMCNAGADVIIAHVGCTVGGKIGVKSHLGLDKCIAKIQAIIDKIKKINSDVIILCQGGPINSPEEAEYIFKNIDHLDGFCGASALERIPIESAITKTIKKFKNIDRK